MIIVKGDLGNSHLKLYVENKNNETKIYIVPTMVAAYRENFLGTEISSSEFPYNLESTVIYNNGKGNENLGRHYVGFLAKKMEGIINDREIGAMKCGDQDLIIVLLTTIAAICEKEGDNIVDLSVSLPLSQFQGYHARYEKQWEGKHEVILHQLNNKPVKFEIKKCVCGVEGVRALEQIALTNPEIQKPNRKILGIDCGEYTTEVIAGYYSLENDNMIFDNFLKLCFPVELGVAYAKQRVIDFLMMKHNTFVDRYDIDFAVKENDNKIYLDNGSMFDISSVYNPALYELANDIVKKIFNVVKSHKEKPNIECMFLYGGAAEILDFAKHFSDLTKKIIGVDCFIKDNPSLANIE